MSILIFDCLLTGGGAAEEDQVTDAEAGKQM